MKPLCQTCTNIFDFPKCCTESLSDSVKIVTCCENYSGNDKRQLQQAQELEEYMED